MSFKVSFQGFNGHEDDPAVDDSDNEPDIWAFDTEAERTAFIQGCNITAQAMDGWVDARIEVKRIEAEPEPNHSGYDEAREFLSSLADLDHDVAAAKITEWLDLTPTGTNRIIPLVQVARDYREDGPLGGSPESSKMLDLFMVVKEALLNGS